MNIDEKALEENNNVPYLIERIWKKTEDKRNQTPIAQIHGTGIEVGVGLVKSSLPPYLFVGNIERF